MASSSSSNSSSMAELMAKQSEKLVTYKKGDLVKGTITKLAKNEVLVDLHAKGEAVVLEKERGLMNMMLKTLKIGDEVEVGILNPESETGQTVVSLRRFMDQRLWVKLEALKKSKEALTVTVTESTKGGYVVMLNGANAFLPHSHTSFSQGQLAPGQEIQVTVYDLLKTDNKIIVSQKSAVSDDEFAKIKKTVKSGDKLSATITNITSFGIFASVAIPGGSVTLDGLIHISEIAWEKTEDIGSTYSQGQKLQVYLVGFDNDAKRLELSIKRLSEDPFEKISAKYPVETKVKGVVKSIEGGNIHIVFDGVEGIIRKEKVPAGTEYAVDQEVNVTISEVDKKRHRILLSPVLLEKPLMYR